MDIYTPSGKRRVAGAYIQEKLTWEWLEVVGALRYDSYWDIVTYPGHDGHFSGRKCAPLGAAPAYYNASWCSVTQHPTPQWFSRAKFGIYAHWGPYSVPAFSTEWYSRNMYVNSSTVNKHHIQTWGEGFGYKDFVPLFTADKFNASAWAELSGIWMSELAEKVTSPPLMSTVELMSIAPSN